MGQASGEGVWKTGIVTDTTPHVRPGSAASGAVVPASGTHPARRGSRAYRRAVAALMLAVAAWGVLWSVTTPAFRAPDEQTHLDSVLRIAYGGGWPAPGDAWVAPAIADAVDEAAYPADPPGRWVHRPDERQLVDVEPVPREDRTRVDTTNAVGDASSGTEIDQMTQHPPAYYALGAAVLRVTGLADARWDQAMLALRLLDVVLLALVVPLAAGAARRVTGSASAGLVAASFPLFLPQLGHVMGSVNNDAFVVLAGAGATYLAARVVTGDLRWRVAVALGAVVGLGLLGKVMLAFALPMVGVAYLLARGRPWPARLGRLAVATAAAGVVGGWWWVRNVLMLGAVQPVGRPRDLDTMAPVADGDVASLITEKLAQAFFGNLSWLEIRLDGRWVVAGSIALGVAALVAVALPGARRAAVALLLFPAGLAAGVAFNAWDFHAETGRLAAVQGRYLFAGVAALAGVVAIALWQLARRAERRLAVAVPVVVALALVTAVAGLRWAFLAFYRGPGESAGDAVDRWLAWSPLEPPALAAVVVLAALALVAALAVAVPWPLTARAARAARPARRTGADGAGADS